ncbi:MAG: DUF4136 domain-containing protein [Algoriphagus sp.]|uniref:DUF4136 domain-containing protein n=1 Tax=Algoriphagus sp. TaxID=1872435 RepID=UPI001797650C|nr:DUF4136 domain-containing protein [Algoriphagus sp.]NVJ87694.1 DUF4136 domain-containing protein [Algoriphagus sp.]
MKTKFLFLLVVPILMIACSGKKYVIVPKGVYEDFKLSEYKTFGFYDVKGPENPGPYFETNIKEIQDAITAKMQERGLQFDPNNPDLQINLGISVQEKVQTRTTNPYTDPFMYTGQRNYTWSVREVPVNTYQEGSLTMHLVDNREDEAVWIGTIDRALPKKQKNMEETIQSAVDLLFLKINN